MRVSAISSATGYFSLLSLDNASQLAESLSLDLSLLDNVELLKKIEKLLFLNLGPEMTGVVLDPIYSLDLLATKSFQAGVLMRLEQDKTFPPTALPELFPNFSLEELKNNYSLAKLSLFYHPQEEKALEKKKLLAEIKDYCRILGIDFLLDLKIYNPAKSSQNHSQSNSQNHSQNEIQISTSLTKEEEQPGEVTPLSFQEAQLTAVQELRHLADIFVLEYPGDPLSVATLSAELDQAWLLSSTEKVSYADYKELFRESVENGTQGFLLGKILWEGMANFREEGKGFDLENLEKFIQTTVRDRVLELNRIIREHFSSDE